uniref:Thioredoxin domain-containing protein n=1 Tax=Amphimedon queenslandica TaxID=400682 RepID=A0A1X7ULK7_AMPQE
MDSIIAILMLLMGSWRMICSETETQDIATGTESVYEPPSIFSEQEKLAETNSPTPLVPITEGPNLTGHNSSLNSTGSKLKPICTLEQGCVPPLTCVGVNTSLLNDSHMTGVFGKRGVVNVTSAQLETLLDSPVFTNSCLLVLYYATWCPYSVDFMPTYNELGLVFPNDSLTIVALDFGKKDE